MRNPSSGTNANNNNNSSGNPKTPCCNKVGLKRGPWTPEEDELLSDYIKKEGEGRWRTLPKRAGLLRCGKSCRLRWMNYLRPNVKRGQIAPDEEDLILRLHRLLGNRWSLIAGRIPGRTDNEIKNFWNTHLSKKLISQGIDPRTHKPLVNPNNNTSSSATDNANAKLSSSSSKMNQIIQQRPLDLSPSSAMLEERVNHDHTGYFGRDSNLEFPSSTGIENILRNSQGLTNDDDAENNYCVDDVFSSFLNSLINEDMFSTQQIQQPNGIFSPASAATTGFGFEAAALLSSAAAFNQKDPKILLDDPISIHGQPRAINPDLLLSSPYCLGPCLRLQLMDPESVEMNQECSTHPKHAPSFEPF